MACLSNIREVKDLIGTLLCQNLCSSDTSMRYIKLGEEFDSMENLEDLMQDMFSVERLNLDMDVKHFCDVSSTGSDSMNLSDLFGSSKGVSASCSEDSVNHGESVVYKSLNSTGISNHDNRSELDSDENTIVVITREEKEEREVPYKFVVTYEFDFDTEDDFDNNDICGSLNEVNTTDLQSYDDDEDFEGEFFNSDCDISTDKFNPSINGSKNNLLDDSYDPEENSSKSIGLVDYDSTSGDENSDKENDGSVELHPCPVTYDRLHTETRSKPTISPSMRKGYIYYSSELRLYSGELNYERMVPDKKYKFVKKLFKKMFPTNKYVVNA